MKICLVTDFLPGYHKIWGGSEMVCLSLAKIGGIPQFVKDGFNGFLVEHN